MFSSEVGPRMASSRVSAPSCMTNDDDFTDDAVQQTKRHALQHLSTFDPMLPPCRICSEKASGFHYGANTCEACKVSASALYGPKIASPARPGPAKFRPGPAH